MLTTLVLNFMYFLKVNLIFLTNYTTIETLEIFEGIANDI